jgi:hypothetical protein
MGSSNQSIHHAVIARCSTKHRFRLNRSLKASLAGKGLSEEDQARFVGLQQEAKAQQEQIKQLQDKLQKAKAVRASFERTGNHVSILMAFWDPPAVYKTARQDVPRTTCRHITGKSFPPHASGRLGELRL